MATYRMSDGTVVKTENATKFWDEASYHDGHNFISRATRTEWNHEALYRSRKGRYYVEHTSDWERSVPRAEWVSNEEAVRWLLVNEHEIPEELKALEEEVTE